MKEKCCAFVLPVHYARERVRCIQRLNRKAASAGGNVAHKVRKVAAMSTRHGTISIALWRWAGWVIGSKSRPGASESVLEDYRAGLPDEDAERYTAEGFQSCI